MLRRIRVLHLAGVIGAAEMVDVRFVLGKENLDAIIAVVVAK